MRERCPRVCRSCVFMCGRYMVSVCSWFVFKGCVYVCVCVDAACGSLCVCMEGVVM